MDVVVRFFTENLVFVYFFYGLSFFALGLVVLLESGRASEFRFARALEPLAWFGMIHGVHEWFEMFKIFAAERIEGMPLALTEGFGLGTLVASFLLLLTFGTRLLPGAEDRPRASRAQVLAMGGLWLVAVGVIEWRYRPDLEHLFTAADVLARYSLAIPGALLASWALLRERRDFHARGMSQYGRSLLWAALAFAVYGVIGQIFSQASLVWPSQTFNTALFIRTFGFPVQLLRAFAAAGIAFHLGKALRAFEAESRIRLARANKARIEAQAAALEAQQHRADEVEALNQVLRVTAQVVQEREAQLEDLVRKLVHAQEDERQRIARELHDETGQKLTALGMGLAALEVTLASGDPTRTNSLLRNLRDMSDQAITELRNIMANLRPAQLDDLGLVPALRWYVNQYQAQNPQTRVQLTVDRVPNRLPPEHETILFRVAQEALTNVQRHAQATHVSLRLSQDDSCVRLEVKDDGAGFDPKQPPRHEPGSGLGLPGMRERVGLVRGRLDIDSAPGEGASILVELPLR